MSQDIFGSLLEWNQVLKTLDDLREKQLLDEHQNGLARVLRYRKNWQLLERVLTYATDIRQASDPLIAEVQNVLVSPDVYIEARVLAARALGHLIPRRPPQEHSLFDMDRVLQTMSDLLVPEGQGSGPLHAAVSEALAAVRAHENGEERSSSNEPRYDPGR